MTENVHPMRPNGRPDAVPAFGLLVVDDHRLMRRALELWCQDRGFAAWIVADGASALEIYRSHQREIDLIVLDVNMPGMSGPEILGSLRRINPDAVFCFMTAGSAVFSEHQLRSLGPLRVLRKPLQFDELNAVIMGLLNDGARTPERRKAVGF